MINAPEILSWLSFCSCVEPLRGGALSKPALLLIPPLRPANSIAKKTIFEILISLDIPIQTPITVHVANVGVIIMAENVTSNLKTRNISLKNLIG